MTDKQTQFNRLTEKNIFIKKLSGEPIDIMTTTMNDMLGHDVCLLLRKGVFDDPVGQYHKFICRYPVRIWHRCKGHTTKVDWLKPGDVWEFGRRFE